MIMIRMNTRSGTTISLALVSSLLVAACATGDEEAPDQESDASTPATEEAADTTSDHAVDPASREVHEAGGPQPRIAITHDGGVSVLDGSTLEALDTFSAEGFVRVNDAGDHRHAFLTEGDSFRLLDLGSWAEPHGDHDHFYTTDPLLTEIGVEGDTPGHALSHDGIGALFFDGTGEIHWYDPTALDAEAEIETTSVQTEEAHHGVAVPFADGSWLETLGDEDERSGARVLDAQDQELARTEQCPGVHGEAVGPAGEGILGCEDGVIVFADGEFRKIEAGPEFARTGNLFASEESSVVLGDYREDQDAPMTEIALVDLDSDEISTVDVGTAYNFRSLARGPEGEVLVLGEDGDLQIIDPDSGDTTERIEVLEDWTEPEEWQEPRPAVVVSGDIAYVTDPARQQLHMVDLSSHDVIHSAELDHEPNEIVVTSGRAAPGAPEGEHDDHAEDHDDDADAGGEDGHDHDHDEEDHDH